MQDSFSRYLEGSRQAIRHWWLLLAGGVLLFLTGLAVLAFPAQSYVGMAVLFGWLMLLTGVVETVVAARNTHYVTGRGWMLAWGVVEIVLGLILVFNVALSSAMLPVVLGFWLLMRGFNTIGLGGDMRALGVPGAGWTIVCGILLLPQRLDVPGDRVYCNIDRCGNTSAASIGICLDEIVRGGQVNKDDYILLTAFGGGLTWGAMLVRR